VHRDGQVRVLEELSGIVPKLDGYRRVARCLMLYDWKADVGPEWLELVERSFRRVQLEPVEATATSGDQKSHGSYKRLRKRLAEFLSQLSAGTAHPNIIVSAGSMADGEAFFPFRASIVLNSIHPALVSVMVAMDETLVSSCEELLAMCGEEVFAILGPAYGCAWNFPCVLGPSFYLASVIARPAGVEPAELDRYGERLTRWRDRRWAGHRPTFGYLREVYPINFVLERHLSVPFSGHALTSLMQTTGRVSSVRGVNGLFKWEVSADRLCDTRVQLENSGLVLSAVREPIRL